MARIAGVEEAQAGPLTRLMYWFTRRKLGRVPLPSKIAAHAPAVYRGVSFMEMGQMQAGSLPPSLKALAQVKVATLIGCPF